MNEHNMNNAAMGALGLGAANIYGGARLGQVVMPLVRLLQSNDLSWSDREQIADAIMVASRHHKGMADEKNHLAAAQGQQISAERALRS